MHNPHKVTNMHDFHDRPADRSRGPLAVMTLGDDPIKELAASAQFHDQMDRLLVLISPFELNNVWLATQVLHNLNLPLDVLFVILARQLPLRYRLAGELPARRVLSAEVGQTKLPSAQLLPKCVVLLDIIKGLAQDCV